MPEGFIPLNQSTPVHHNQHGGRRNFHQRHPNNRHSNGPGRGDYNRSNRWSNSPRNESNSSYNTDGQEKMINIDDYLNRNMLLDPWYELRQRQTDQQ